MVSNWPRVEDRWGHSYKNLDKSPFLILNESLIQTGAITSSMLLS